MMLRVEDSRFFEMITEDACRYEYSAHIRSLFNPSTLLVEYSTPCVRASFAGTCGILERFVSVPSFLLGFGDVAFSFNAMAPTGIARNGLSFSSSSLHEKVFCFVLCGGSFDIFIFHFISNLA